MENQSFFSRLGAHLSDAGWNSRAFCCAMWLIVIIALAAILSKAIFQEPSATPLHYLIATVIVAAFLALLVSSGIFGNLRRWGFKAFGVELSGDLEALTKTPPMKEVPHFFESSIGKKRDGPANTPFPLVSLTKREKYLYERFSHLLYSQLNSINDPNDLKLDDRETFRNLIKYVAKAAFAEGHFTKHLEIAKHLETFRDRELSADELAFLGTARIWAADETRDLQTQRGLYEESLPYFHAARGKNPSDVRAAYNLGWVLLMIDQYEDSIKLLRACVEMSPSVAPWAQWNIACAQTKQSRKEAAMSTLREIAAGPWWNDIWTDDDFSELKKMGPEFESLCEEKGATTNSSSN